MRTSVGRRPRSLRPCLIGEMFKQRPQRPGSGHALWERQTQRRTPFLQLEALGIDADATPVSVGRAEQFGGVYAASIRVVCIHVRNRASLGFD